MLNTVLITRHKHTRIGETFAFLKSFWSNRRDETSSYINKCHSSLTLAKICRFLLFSSWSTIVLDISWHDLILGQLGIHLAACYNVQLIVAYI